MSSIHGLGPHAAEVARIASRVVLPLRVSHERRRAYAYTPQEHVARVSAQRCVPHHKLLLSATRDDHCHRRPAEVGSGLPRASRRRPAEVGSGLPRAHHGISQADGAEPMSTSVCAAAKWPYRRHPAGRGRHRLPRGGQRRAAARCLPWLKILWAPAGNVPAAKARQTRVDFNAAAWIMVNSMTHSIKFSKIIYCYSIFFSKYH